MDAKTDYNGVFADPAVFANKVRLLWIGIGTTATALGLGAQVTEDFLRKYKFNPTLTDEMERRTFNTVK